MITFEQIDAAVKSVSHDDPETVATMTDLMTNEQFTVKTVEVAKAISKDIMLSGYLHGETDQSVLAQAVFEGTITTIAITMLMAGRALERQSAQSIADLLGGLDTTEE